MDSSRKNAPDAANAGGVAGIAVPGQWRLARVELYNWGTFDKYHAFDVSRDGLLLTGASGSGKSTIIDAISTVMSPQAKAGYNAAASNGARRDRGRTYNNYVRGAWGHVSDESGEAVRTFLRPREATWSGILLRFEDGTDVESMGASERRRHEPVNLAAVFFQKRNAVNDDSLKVFYAAVRGKITLSDLEKYGRAGADIAQFNRDYKNTGQAWRDHAPFLARVCSVFGINSPKTLTLLQKTQAAKNIGSLDDLFRRYMLDQPLTFQQADAAVEQFEELEGAHRGVVLQRKQMEVLEPLEGMDAEYAKQREAQLKAESLKDASGAFAEMEIVQVLDAALEEAARRENLLQEDLADAEQAFDRARTAYDTAAAVLSDKGGIALSTAQMDVDQRRLELRTVEQNRKLVNRRLEDAGQGSLPDTLHGFEALRREVRVQADEAAAWVERNAQRKERLYADAYSQRMEGKAIQDELRHLRAVRSNIPRDLHAVRSDIASHLGVGLSDVPFVGELVDVRPEEADWTGAIERLLRNRAQTMLVEKRFAPAVASYLEGRHLGLRFEYDAVPEQVEVPGRTLNARSLVRKVVVQSRDDHPAFTLWVNRLLRMSFDYVCVDDAADMAQHTHALTRGGQVKAGDHFVKDDRSRIDDRSRWVLGSSNDAKISQLERDLKGIARLLAQAQDEVAAFERREGHARALGQLAQELEARSWQELDVAAVQAALKHSQAFLESLLQDESFRRARDQRDKAQQAKDAAEAALRDVRVKLDTCRQDMARQRAQRDEHREKADYLCEQQATPTDAEALQLRNELKRADREYRRSADAVYQASAAVSKRLDRRVVRAVEAQQEAQRSAELVMQRYKDAFPAEAANLAARFSDRKGFIDRYQQIKTTGLAKYEGKFLEVLADFSQDQITVIATEIRNAFRDVRDRLEPVNRSLMLSPFSPGIHLQIEVREARSARVERFLADLREITSGSWEVGDVASAEQRYERTAAVMRRLKSPERVDREWRRECLNTPGHMKFIAKEVDADGDVVNIHSNDEGLSGGQKQKLVFFCLAAALRYQLSDEDEPVPSYGTIVLDEAFDKSDRHFAEEALNIFRAFNFHMVLATPGKLLQTIEGHVGGVVLVSCEDGRQSRLSPVLFEDAAGEGDAAEPVKPAEPAEPALDVSADAARRSGASSDPRPE